MPRPRKGKRVCCLPDNNVFGQLNRANEARAIVIMKVEEYEAIRLIDHEGLMQEECAEKMGVARATVQKLYQDARKKIADSLVNGSILRIEGGDYQLYDDHERYYGGCGRHRRFGQNYPQENNGDNKKMKIVIPVEQPKMDGGVSPSFGRAAFFLVYDVEQKTEEFIKNTAAENRGGAGIAAAQLIVDTGAKVLIVPRLGENAAEVLKASGLIIKKSVSSSIEETIKAFVNNELMDLTSIHAGFHGHQ
ncbi:MAG: DUF134 domain-containing protein [Bacilli bacterium]